MSPLLHRISTGQRTERAGKHRHRAAASIPICQCAWKGFISASMPPARWPLWKPLCVGRAKSLRRRRFAPDLPPLRLPGRFEIVQVPDGPLVVLDGAHNDMAARSLVGPVRALCAKRGIQRVLLVIGMLTGHAPEGVLEALAPLADSYHRLPAAMETRPVRRPACRDRTSLFPPHQNHLLRPGRRPRRHRCRHAA